MGITKIYLDNCCYNRPFDDLTNETVKQEAQAKMFIQSLVRYGSLSLVYSYMSIIEINDSPFEYSKRQITKYIEDYATVYVSNENISQITSISSEIMTTGVKNKDAIHLSCAFIAEYVIFSSPPTSEY